MQLIELQRTAETAYDEGHLSTYFGEDGQRNYVQGGDTLAAFVVETIARSYVSTETDNKQILSAAQSIEEAAHTLLRLKAGLERMVEDEVIEEEEESGS